VLVALLAAATASAMPVPPPGKPPTIPAVREWHPAPGGFELRRTSRVVFRDARLAADAALFARELRRPAVAGVPVGPGDIELALGARDRRLGREGYTLDVGQSVRIGARTRAGVFYGTRTVLQRLNARGAIQGGHARDWPNYPERGLMLDNGRRYFPPGWIKRQIRLLAYLKLNQLHLHFSDNQGLRIESERHPEVVSNPHLTKRQLRDILAVARRYHVRVIPELDMPGHLQAALSEHPELQAPGHPDELDIRKPAARRFARDLIVEYLALFGGRYWHAGADEYASAGDFGAFVNWIARLVRSRGRTLRVWHDGLDGARLPRDVVVEWWAEHAGPSPRELLAQGHRVLNAGWWPTYYVVSPLGRVRPSMRVAYRSWQINAFGGLSIDSPLPGNPPQVVRRHRDRILGSELHVWNDVPDAETLAQTTRGIAPRLRLVAQKTWGSPRPAHDYDGFVALWNRVRP
jgi:hexosaminidase